jgi:hypothetical protein
MSASSTYGNGSGKLSRARGLLLAATLLSLVLWFLPGANLLAFPIRMFVTLIHEGGHALMTVLTGGRVDYIAMDPLGNGVTRSETGASASFLIYMAGYLGATLFGAACLHLMRRPNTGRRGLMLMAAVVLAITVLWVHPARSPFGFLMGLVVGGGLIAAANWLREPTAAFLVSFLSVQLCLNALMDIRDLLWLTTRTHADNDAVFMAERFGFTPWFWAILWAAGAVAILSYSLRAYWRASK